MQLGGVAQGTLQNVAKGSRLPSYGTEIASGREHVEAVVAALGGFGKSIRGAITTAEAAGDAGSADLFTEISRAADKRLWFVEAHTHSAS